MSEDIPCPLATATTHSPLASCAGAITGNKRKCYNYANLFINWGLKIIQECLNESSQWKLLHHVSKKQEEITLMKHLSGLFEGNWELGHIQMMQGLGSQNMLLI